MKQQPKLLIFDVNETLLDMSPLRKAVNDFFKNDLAFEVWFPTLLQYSLVETTSGKYHDFSKIAVATLKMTAVKFNIKPEEEKLKSILGKVKQLPAHPDVPIALEKLKSKGIPMIALTNGKPDVAVAQLKYAGIDRFFDEIISVERIGKYKPHPDTYNYVLQKKTVAPDKVMMIASHGWDIAGAQRAGLQTAFVSRPAKMEYPLAERATISAASCTEIAEILLSDS